MLREDLLAVLYDDIARYSMVQYNDAERLIEEETARWLGGTAAMPAAPSMQAAAARSLGRL